MIKKYCIMMLAISFAVVNLTACGVEANNDSKNENTDINSSHYSVNYTDVGDESSSRSNVSENVDRSQPEKETSKAQTAKEAEKNSSITSPNASENVKNSSVTTSGITNKTTVTYYYTDDTGEQHATDTEIDVSTDASNSDDPSKTTSENKTSSEEEQVNEDSDVQSEITEDTDTDLEEDTDSDDTEIAQGSFEEEDLVIYYEGAAITLGASMNDIINAIGNPDTDHDVGDSADDKRKEFSYINLFSFEAVPNEDVSDYTITMIEFFDHNLATEKGVHIDTTVEEVRKVYGPEDEIENGEYRYYYGDKYLFLGVQNDIVSDFGYRYVDYFGNDETI